MAKPLSLVIQTMIVFLSLLPIVFLPLTQEFYDTNKWAFLILFTLLLILVWTYKAIRSSVSTISFSPATIGLGAISVASILSTFLVSPNKIEALINPFGPITFLCLTIISLFFPAFHTAKTQKQTLWILFITIALLALITVYQFFGMGKLMFPGVTYLADPLWTPTGSTIATIALFIIMLPLLLREIRQSTEAKNEMTLSFSILLTVIVAAGLGITVWQLIPRISGTLLPARDGWAIMLEILKNPKQAFFGVGADNFLAAFSIGRPVSLNLSPLWSVRFTTNTNMLFHLVTIYGLIGCAAFIVFARAFLVHMKKNAHTVSLLFGIITLLVTPPSVSVLVVLALLLILEPDEKTTTLKLHVNAVWSRIVICFVSLLIVSASVYGFVNYYSAELAFFRSLTFAQQNNGTATYNTQVAVIKQNHYISTYHIVFNQTNMALATALANSINQPQTSGTASKDQITKDRQLVAQLIQQAISEAKSAVALNNQNVIAWENLARTYGQLIGVAQGADNWTIAGYQQAIQLDPTNPVLHLELGSVLVQTKNYANAITEFQRAATLKPNYANAYYNLYYVYKANNDITQATTALEKALTLVDKNSDDYRTVSTELENLKKTPPVPVVTPPVNKTPVNSTTSLSKPSPTPKVVPPLTLPTNSGPGISP